MFDFSKVKLIIWDLDNTFWNGTISENEIIEIHENNELIKMLCDCGIVNSICSKNDFEIVKNKLLTMGLWELFVFPSINWQSKGTRIKEIINSMNLRNENTLFIDDNTLNLEEALFCCPKLMTASPSYIKKLIHDAVEAPKNDLLHKRLAQYKVLEEKNELRSEATSDIEFLNDCNINVQIKYDCESEIERLYELVMRSNQLNFTKNRPSIDEFTRLLQSTDIINGYVEVTDKFGDYGIVGFFTIKNNQLIHFVFSCRILGMQIEQYVFAQLGFPKIEVIGEVAAKLKAEFIPYWINNNVTTQKCKQSEIFDTILFKGPCDISSLFSFIKKSENIFTEFTYTARNGSPIFGNNHSATIVTLMKTNDTEKANILSKMPFVGEEYFKTQILLQKFKYIFFSLITENANGVYKFNGSEHFVSHGAWWLSINDPENRKYYLSQGMTADEIDIFNENFSYVDNSDISITIQSLKEFRRILPQETILYFILSSEKNFFDDQIGQKVRLFHEKTNDFIRSWATECNNIKYIEIDKYTNTKSDYADSLTHFSKHIYYKLAVDLTDIISKADQFNEVTLKSKAFFLYICFLAKVIRVLKMIFPKQAIFFLKKNLNKLFKNKNMF